MNEQKITPLSTKWALEKLLPLIKNFPNVVKPNIGVEAFTEELLEAARILVVDSPYNMSKYEELQPFIEACPHILKSEISLEEFTRDLLKALKIFAPCIMTEEELKLYNNGRAL